jgi:hypothetical protein
MALVALLTTLVDVLAVAVLARLVRRSELVQAQALAERQAVLARLRGELADLVGDAERRTRALDEALATREATLRVLLQTAAPVATTAGERSVPDPAEVRLLRDLELSLERRAQPLGASG